MLRSALNHAATEELVTRKAAALVKLPPVRRRRGRAWSSDEARRFLESARSDRDPLYAVYVLILVLGLRKGEVLGLTEDAVDLAAGGVVDRLAVAAGRRPTAAPGDQDADLGRHASAAGHLCGGARPTPAGEEERPR